MTTQKELHEKWKKKYPWIKLPHEVENPPGMRGSKWGWVPEEKESK